MKYIYSTQCFEWKEEELDENSQTSFGKWVTQFLWGSGSERCKKRWRIFLCSLRRKHFTFLMCTTENSYLKISIYEMFKQTLFGYISSYLTFASINWERNFLASLPTRTTRKELKYSLLCNMTMHACGLGMECCCMLERPERKLIENCTTRDRVKST